MTLQHLYPEAAKCRQAQGETKVQSQKGSNCGRFAHQTLL